MGAAIVQGKDVPALMYEEYRAMAAAHNEPPLAFSSSRLPARTKFEIAVSIGGSSDKRPAAARNRSNVWRYPGVNSFARCGEEGNLLALHPTVKPVAMVADAILDCSARSEIVLDAFLGSGTTVIAAERTGRRCYGLELDPAYVDTLVRRWQRLTGASALHAVSGRGFDDLADEAEAADAT
jgi:hypothetical protein